MLLFQTQKLFHTLIGHTELHDQPICHPPTPACVCRTWKNLFPTILVLTANASLVAIYQILLDMGQLPAGACGVHAVAWLVHAALAVKRVGSVQFLSKQMYMRTRAHVHPHTYRRAGPCSSINKNVRAHMHPHTYRRAGS